MPGLIETLFPRRTTIIDLKKFRIGSLMYTGPIGDNPLARQFIVNDNPINWFEQSFIVEAHQDFVMDIRKSDMSAGRNGITIVFPERETDVGWKYFHENPISKYLRLSAECSNMQQAYLTAAARNPRDPFHKLDTLKTARHMQMQAAKTTSDTEGED